MPTTGIRFDTAALAVFEVTASTLLLSVPSTDTSVTNNVKITPIIHIVLDLSLFANLSICTLFDIFDTIPRAVDTSTIGIAILFIKFPISDIINTSIG